ncbi:uncharacterized protein LOC124115398 [Haliotis rufescens]|uniref:uncharacterized protein LOC124115398 n=1 Tax=Haliotis rufescens TaxID=6454 RepID=UPI00201F15D2|nr:uncharacterized protein LOC124115398 [Haliotis rufescens]
MYYDMSFRRTRKLRSRMKIIIYIIAISYLLVAITNAGSRVFFGTKRLLLNRNGHERECSKSMGYLPSGGMKLEDMVLDPSRAFGTRRGGENITEVKYQDESTEFFNFELGVLRTLCRGTPGMMRHLENRPHQASVNDVTNVITVSNKTEMEYMESLEGLTVGIVRIDYANMYWTVIELYNAYLNTREMNRTAAETTILILDAHPATALDGLWELLFKKVVRVGWLKKKTLLEQFVLVPELKPVPIVRKAKSIPYIDDLRYDVSDRAGGFLGRKLACGRIRITVVLRNNYIAHPRNVRGIIERQFNNSDELIQALKNTFPETPVQAVALETLTIREQIQLITETDILIGVHGAGLALTLFQVPGTGLIELFPHKYKQHRNNHMEQLAVWGGKLYSSWYSNNKFAPSVHVPPRVLTDMVLDMSKLVCGGTL